MKGKYEVIKLGTVDTTFQSLTSCCVSGQTLYVTGAGENQDQIWTYDLQSRTAKHRGR